MMKRTELMNYRDLRDELERRLSCLKSELGQCIKRLEQAPEGTLRANTIGKRQYFYHVNETKNHIHNGIYIPKSNIQLVKDLSQKEYDRKFINYATKEIKGLEKYLHMVPEEGTDSVLHALGKGRAGLYQTSFESDEEYITNWKKKKYIRKKFDEDAPEFYTKRGERVRSKSEVIIAGALDDYNIPYRYECPLNLGNRVVYPDFTVLNVRKRQEYIYEHLGMMDDEEYSQKAFKKIANYESAGYYLGRQLIISYETSYNPLSTTRLKNLIKQHLL